jgi:hypothetical protein
MAQAAARAGIVYPALIRRQPSVARRQNIGAIAGEINAAKDQTSAVFPRQRDGMGIGANSKAWAGLNKNTFTKTGLIKVILQLLQFLRIQRMTFRVFLRIMTSLTDEQMRHGASPGLNSAQMVDGLHGSDLAWKRAKEKPLMGLSSRLLGEKRYSAATLAA